MADEMRTQAEIDAWVDKQNRKDGYNPAAVEIMLNTEKILAMSVEILSQTERLVKQIEEMERENG